MPHLPPQAERDGVVFRLALHLFKKDTTPPNKNMKMDANKKKAEKVLQHSKVDDFWKVAVQPLQRTMVHPEEMVPRSVCQEEISRPLEILHF